MNKKTTNGKKITAYLEKDNITAEKLSEITGQPLWRVNNFLAGEFTLPLRNAWALARKYGKLTHEMYSDYGLHYDASYNFKGIKRIKTLPKLRDNNPEPLEVLLKLNGINKEELAKAVDVSAAHLSNIAKHHYIPSLHLALKIAKELNSTVELLFYWVWEV